MGRIIRYTFAGAIGLLAAWLVMEPTSLMPDYQHDLAYYQYFLIGLISGLFIGLLLGLAGALSAGSSREAARTVIVSTLFGACGGIVGLSIGSKFYSVLYTAANSAGLFSFILLLIGRGFGWALIGGLIGISQGVASANPKKMVNGAIGGFIGGGLGGAVFEILVWMNKGGVSNFPPAMIRFIAFGSTGAAIGLFLGFVEEIAKKAWLIRVVGRNEGKEILLFKQVTMIGRDETADIPIFSDPDVSARHAIITSEGKRHLIEDAGSTYGTRLNGAKITKRELLTDGDSLEIGKTKFTYRDKASARSYDPQRPSPVQIPTSSHVCPYCGAVKDANGNCDCTVGTQPAQPPQQPFGGQTMQQPLGGQTMQQPLGGQTMQQPAQDMGQTIQNQMTQQIGSPSPSPFGGQTMPLGADPAPAAGQGGARLVGTSGPYAQHTYLLDHDMQIGRDATKDIALSLDNSVSRNHAHIALEAGACVLYDDGSTNGTYVNGQKITRHQLAPSDVVQIGSTKFRFEL